MKWIKESNRMKHFYGVMAVSFAGTLLMGIGCIGGMEFKDVHHDNGDKPMSEWTWRCWDWLDVALLGLAGRGLRADGRAGRPAGAGLGHHHRD